MKFCNNCGNQLKGNIKFCNSCGVEVGRVINNSGDKESSQEDRTSQFFTYNGVEVDLEDLRATHGKNRINAIKELRQTTEISLKASKEIIDEFYSAENPRFDNINIGESDNKGCLNIILWIFFLPIMLIKLILETDRFSNNTKILLIIGSVIVSMGHITGYIGILVGSPQLIIIAGIVFLIYRNKKQKEVERKDEVHRKEEARRIEEEKRKELIIETLEIFFNNKDMSIRLEEFILQHTKKYDDDQIDYSDYLKRIDMLSTYINNKLDAEIKIGKEDYREEILEYWKKKREIKVERKLIEEFIENKKMKIYADDLKKIINRENYNRLEDVVKEYIDIFGENALKSLNIEILSDSLGEDFQDIQSLVNREYGIIKRDYEMRKLENDLFMSDSTFKNMEYIDKLSGFEFEDYLEDLFAEFGYTVKELPYSNDYGADLIISKGFNEIVIQAKNYSTNVGNKAVQEVIAAKSHYKSDIGMVITNAYYTQNAIKTAEASSIILIDRDGLEKIINEGSIYFNSLVI